MSRKSIGELGTELWRDVIEDVIELADPSLPVDLIPEETDRLLGDRVL